MWSAVETSLIVTRYSGGLMRSGQQKLKDYIRQEIATDGGINVGKSNAEFRGEAARLRTEGRASLDGRYVSEVIKRCSTKKLHCKTFLLCH
jgi:hypothetical protein